MTMRPDPTFHASPKLAMEAPPENFAYTLLLSPDFSKPDALAITILVARICQTSVHLSFDQTNPIAAIRFAFFFVQAACMIAMGVIAAVAAGS